MSDHFTLYSLIHSSLPREAMLQLGHGLNDVAVTPEILQEGEGAAYIFRWPDGLIFTIRDTMRGEELQQHLRGFAGWVQHIYGGNVPPRGTRIMQRVLATTLAVATIAEPGRDTEGRVEEMVGRMVGGLQSIMFHDNCIWDGGGKLLLAPDGTFDPDAEL